MKPTANKNKKINTQSGKQSSLQCLDPKNWELPSKNELTSHYDRLKERKSDSSILMFQKHLAPVDVYTYLKVRFGEPNGFANFLKSPTSDNLIHWDYLLKCGDIFINIMGIHRGVQISIHTKLNNENWRTLVRNFHESFANTGKEKSRIKRDLEEWSVFINRYTELCSEAEGHYDKLAELKDFEFKAPIINPEEGMSDQWQKKFERLTSDFHDLQQSCLSLKLLTPIILEAFINLIILIACKKEVRENKTVYEARIKEDLRIKIPSLHLTCSHFANPIDTNAVEYKNFSKIMSERNWFFHGNADPKKDKLETVYFEKNTPLYKTPGNIHEKYFGTLINMIQPKEILENYERAHEFIIYVVNCFEEKYREELWSMLESNNLGYNEKEDRFGVLFPDFLASSHFQGMQYDDDLFDNE